MKKMLFFAAACVALVSCSSDGFIGDSLATSSNGEITFSQNVPNVTRATSTGKEAAEKLGNNFIVYGYKIAKDKTEDEKDTNDKLVMDRYNVSYTDGSANTTLSNTNGWEYVGGTSVGSETQSIKYWDFSAKNYVFSAVSGTGITVDKIKTADDVQGKGWTLTIPQGGSISDLYASDRRVIKKSIKKGDTKNSYETVDFTFYSLISKVRFGFYETVSGYKVKIDKFYYTDDNDKAQNSTTNFAVNGTFKSLNTSGDTKLNVTYASAEDQAQPIMNPSTGASESKFMLFGANIQTVSGIGTQSNAATYDQADGSYTCILPYQSQSQTTPAENVLKLKLDYTLISDDNSGEEIVVTGAEVTVPTQYTQWKNNYAYTYLFKISDNTGGTTGGGDDPKGLYPITFDACVAGVDNGIQETVSTESETTITTYMNGTVVTANDEYTAGDIYYTAMKGGALQDISSSKVYEIYYKGTAPLTEKFVADYANNDVVLIPQTTTAVTEVAGSTIAEANCCKFTAVAGKNYAINCGDGWKIVRVQGTPVDPTFTLKATTDAIGTTTGSAVVTLKTGTEKTSPAVVGAKNNLVVEQSGKDVTDKFVITETADKEGEYTFTLTDQAIKDGAKGEYTVKYKDASTTFNVTITYALDPATVTITAGNAEGATVNLTIGGNAASGTVVNTYKMITVEETKTGEYKVTAAADLVKGDYYITIGGETLKVTVDSYAFTATAITLEMKYNGETTKGTVTLQKNGAAATEVAYSALKGQNDAVATGSSVDGVHTLTAVKPGKFTLTYENASCDVVVNKYTLTANVDKIKASTGTSTLTLKQENTEVTEVNLTNTSGFKVFKGDAEVTTGFTLQAINGKVNFGGVLEKATYTIKYSVGGVVVAQQAIVVE